LEPVINAHQNNGNCLVRHFPSRTYKPSADEQILSREDSSCQDAKHRGPADAKLASDVRRANTRGLELLDLLGLGSRCRRSALVLALPLCLGLDAAVLDQIVDSTRDFDGVCRGAIAAQIAYRCGS
jgi:hypothetical protein